MNKTENITLWEIWNEGKDGQIFEVTDSIMNVYVGKRIKVKETSFGQGHFRTIEHVHNEEAIQLGSHLGSAKYKLVTPYRPISFEQAMERLKQGLSVLAKKPEESEYNYISKLSTTRGWDITYFSDLLDLQFALWEDK